MEKNKIIIKEYYVENTFSLDVAINFLNVPKYCVGCARELIEGDYSKITIECYPHQLPYIEHFLAPCV